MPLVYLVRGGSGCPGLELRLQLRLQLWWEACASEQTGLLLLLLAAALRPVACVMRAVVASDVLRGERVLGVAARRKVLVLECWGMLEVPL